MCCQRPRLHPGAISGWDQLHSDRSGHRPPVTFPARKAKGHARRPRRAPSKQDQARDWTKRTHKQPKSDAELSHDL
jgi:hypothetical protein